MRADPTTTPMPYSRITPRSRLRAQLLALPRAVLLHPWTLALKH